MDTWPNITDYCDAIQYPEFCFDDPDLKAGTPELDSSGMPRARAGNFASVYRINANGRSWAVRFFHRRYADQQSRYLSIYSHLRSHRLAQAAEFEYLHEGVRIKGQWFPALKMEWIDGTPLDDYVSLHLRDRRTLLDVATRFLALAHDLRDSGIAHGDLQHGNILVCGNGDGPSLKIVDFDGMWVPALKGQKSHETGHPNYQHPSRTQADFGPDTDAFSVWSILLSLVAVAHQPGLWQSVRKGDEQLLFSKRDYQTPAGSAVFEALRRLDEAPIVTLASELGDLSIKPTASGLCLPAVAVSAAGLAWVSHPTEPWWPQHAEPSKQANPRRPRPTQPPPLAEPWWPQPAVATQPPTAPWWPQPAVPPPGVQSLRPQPTVRHECLSGSRRLEQATLAAAAAAVLMALVAVALGTAVATFLVGVTVSGAVAVVASLVAGYYFRPEVERKRAAQHMLRARRSEQNRAQRQLDEVHKAMAVAGARDEQHVKSIEARIASTNEEAKRKKRANEDRLRAELAGVKADRAAALKAAENGSRTATADLRSPRAVALLQSRRLTGSSVYGIGSVLVKRLAAAGIRSAADFEGVGVGRGHASSSAPARIQLRGGRWIQVEGIGAAKASALDNWRRKCVLAIERQLPSTIPTDEEKLIKARLSQTIDTLKKREKAARMDAGEQDRLIEAGADAARLALDRELRLAMAALSSTLLPFSEAKLRASQGVAAADQAVSRSRLDLAAYKHVSAAVYLRSVAGYHLPPP